MTRVHEPAVKGIGKRTVKVYVLEDQATVLLIKYVHHFMDDSFKQVVYCFLVQQVLHFQGQVAQDHRQGKVFKVAGSRISLIVLPFRIALAL
ncbi:hypothetical protein D3C87_1646210 [compost metagenome]